MTNTPVPSLRFSTPRLYLSCVMLLFSVSTLTTLAAAETAPKPSGIMVATWELKQKVNELRQDIAMQQGSISQLLDRCLQLFQENPLHLIQTASSFTAVQDVILDDLKKQDLLESWHNHVNILATEQLAEIGDPYSGVQNNGMDVAARLLNIAQSFPRTPAAISAWQRLADLSWDHGQLGSFLYYAEKSRLPSARTHHDDSGDDANSKRIAAALKMVTTTSNTSVPASLNTIDVIWSEQLPASHTTKKSQGFTRNGRNVSLANSRKIVPQAYLPSYGDDSALALNNGSYLLIIDPLLGRTLASPHNLNPGSRRQKMKPTQSYVGNDVILTSTFTNEGAGLLACNSDGTQRWHSVLENSQNSAFISRPIILDGTAFIAFIAYVNSSQRLKLAAFNLSDGTEKWATPRVLAQMNGGNRYGRGDRDLNPDICIHRGHLAILSNRGVIAECTASGHILNLSSYERQLASNQFGRLDRSITVNSINRPGRIRSDGEFLVVAASDSNKLLIRSNNSTHYVSYQGNGHQGNLLDIKNGAALMIDQQIRMVDLRTASLRWSQAVHREATSIVWGRIGALHSIVASGLHLKLYSNTIGSIISSSPIEKDTYVSMHNKMLLYMQERSVQGRGDSATFEKELTESIAKDPKNYHTHISFAVLREAQGKTIEAYHYYLNGLILGAPKKYCEYAALLLRPHLNIQLDNPKFDSYLEELTQLQKIDPRYAQEALWWQARHSESMHRIDQAIAQYTQLLEGDSFIISLSNKMSADIHFMARASILRLHNAKRDDSSFTEGPFQQHQSKKPIHILKPWFIAGGTTIAPLSTDRHIIAYVNGFLRCMDARNGTEVWKQDSSISQPMLGIGPGPGGKNRITVLMGMAAQFSGMKSGDALISFNDESVHDWNGIIKAVAAAQSGSQFKVTVQRNGQELTLSGELGSRPMQAMQYNAQTVLAQYVHVRQDRSKPGLYFPIVDTTNTPHIHIYNIENGDLLWHHSIQRQTLPPLLTPDDLLIESSGGNLIARDVRDPQHPIRWAITGAGHELAQCRIEQHVFIGLDRAAESIHIRNLSTGARILSVPINPDYNYILDGDSMLATLPDGDLALWRLSTAEMLWTAQEALLNPIVISRNHIYCRNARGEIMSIDRTNGLMHRRYPQWSQISHHALHDEILYIVARTHITQKTVCAAIHTATGNVIWEHPVSDELQFLNTVLTSDHGAYFKFAQANAHHQGFLHIATDGAVRAFIPTDIHDRHTIAGNQLILQGFSGLRVANAQASPKQRDIHLRPVTRSENEDEGENNSAQNSEDKKKAFIEFAQSWTKKSTTTQSWDTINSIPYIFAHDNESIYIACTFPEETMNGNWHDLSIRLSDDDSFLNHSNSHLLIQRDKNIINKKTTWRLNNSCDIQNADGSTTRCFQLMIPPLRPVGLQLLIHIEEIKTADNVDNKAKQAGIWWLHRNWHHLLFDK